MSNYTKTTDFAAKDSLSTGDAAKIVKGAEIDAEFEAIETAVATKAELAGSASQNFAVNALSVAGDVTLTGNIVGRAAVVAWARFDGTGTVALYDSFNVSALTDNGTGDYTLTLTNTLNTIHPALAGSAGPVDRMVFFDMDNGNNNTEIQTKVLNVSADALADSDFVCVVAVA